jgi:hypothetical protein
MGNKHVQRFDTSCNRDFRQAGATAVGQMHRGLIASVHGRLSVPRGQNIALFFIHKFFKASKLSL